MLFVSFHPIHIQYENEIRNFYRCWRSCQENCTLTQKLHVEHVWEPKKKKKSETKLSAHEIHRNFIANQVQFTWKSHMELERNKLNSLVQPRLQFQLDFVILFSNPTQRFQSAGKEM